MSEGKYLLSFFTTLANEIEADEPYIRLVERRRYSQPFRFQKSDKNDATKSIFSTTDDHNRPDVVEFRHDGSDLRNPPGTNY